MWLKYCNSKEAATAEDVALVTLIRYALFKKVLSLNEEASSLTQVWSYVNTEVFKKRYRDSEVKNLRKERENMR